jgi:hypothetical protein
LLDTTCSVCHIRYALKYSRPHFLATNYANFLVKKLRKQNNDIRLKLKS